DVKGEFQLAANVYGYGNGVWDISKFEDSQIDNNGTVSQVVKKTFFVTPGSAIRLAMINENAFVDSPIIGNWENGAGKLITKTKTGNNGEMVYTLTVPISTTLPPTPKVLSANNGITGAKIISNITIKLGKKATDAKNTGTGATHAGSKVGMSYGNPIRISTVEEISAMKNIIENGGTQAEREKFTNMKDFEGNPKPSPDEALIASSADAKQFLSVAYFLLEESLSMPNDFYGIGTTTNPFKGFFDGGTKGASLTTKVVGTAPTDNYGFFAKIGNADDDICQIRNLLIYGSLHIESSSSNNVNIGGIVGEVSGYNALLTSCESKVSINAQNEGDIKVGGIIGKIWKAPTMSYPQFAVAPSPEEKTMDYRLKYDGFGTGLYVESTQGTAHAAGGVAYAESTNVTGIEVYIERAAILNAGKTGSYSSGIVSYFAHNGNSSIKGNTFIGDSEFTISSRTQTGESISAGICAWIDQTGTASKCSIFDNIVDSERGTRQGKSLISASDYDKFSVANIYASGYYGKLNAPYSNVHFDIGKSRELLHGEYKIEAIKNGRSSTTVSANAASAVGNVYVGGFIGYGACEFDRAAADLNLDLDFKDLELSAIEKVTASNANGSNNGNASKVCMGVFSGYIELPDTAGLSAWKSDIEKFNFNLTNVSIIAKREQGSNSISTFNQGGLIGAIGRPGGYVADMVTPRVFKMKDINVNLKNVKVEAKQESFKSVPTATSNHLENLGNMSRLSTGGVIGIAYNSEITNLEVSAENSKVYQLQNAKGGADGPADCYTGGIIGEGRYSKLENSKLFGLTATSDFVVSQRANNSSNTPCVGGAVGYAYFGRKSTELPQIPGTKTGNVSLNKVKVERVTVSGDGYNVTASSNYDVIVGGILGFGMGSGGPSDCYGIANSEISNSEIFGNARVQVLSRVGAVGGTYYFVNGLTVPYISRCVSENNIIVSESNGQYASAGGILGDTFGSTVTLENNMSYNNILSAYSTGSNSYTGGISGANASGNLTLKDCFSNARMINVNPTANKIFRGGLIGGGKAATGLGNSYYHIQNAGTTFAVGSGGGGLTAGYGLDFNPLVLDKNVTMKPVFNPATPGALKKSTISDPNGYSSNITFAGGVVSEPTAAHKQDFNSTLNRWEISVNPGSSLTKSSTNSELHIKPWSGASKDYLFGVLPSIVLFKNTVAPTATGVELFEGNNILGRRITSDETLTTRFSGTSIKLTAFTKTNEDPVTPPTDYFDSKYNDGFHNIIWKAYDSDAAGNRISTEVPLNYLTKSALFIDGNNTIEILPLIKNGERKIFYLQAVDYLTGAKVSSFVKIVIDPVYVTSIKIEPIYGDVSDIDDLRGTAANPYVISTGGTYSFNATVAPTDATITKYNFSSATTPPGGTTVRSDGTVEAGANSGTFQLSATSVGKNAVGGMETDTVFVKVAAPINVNFTRIGGSARF
ncbi:MAG: hypothetical protein ACRCUS_07465, partial [Anaerovoracaceae bacterium]